MKTTLIRKDERQRILHLFSDSIPQTVRFSAVAADGSDRLAGTVEVAGSRWLFGKPPVHHPLAHRNAVRKGMFDTHFSIYVTPEQDTEVTLHSRHFTSKMLVWTLAAVIVLAIVAAVMTPSLSGG